MKTFLRLIAAAAFALVGAQAQANVCTTTVNNCDPPVGNVVFDLQGQPIPHTYTQYTVSFVAVQATTNISFQLREDPAFFFLDDIVMTHNAVGPNLLTNGDFEGGSDSASQPLGWSYLNLYGATFAGFVTTNGPHGGTHNYYDGSVGAYDGITQAVATTIGDSYTLSFWLTDDSSQSIGSRISENGLSGIDMLVYAGVLPTITVPEPGSVALLGLGIAGLALARRRKSK